MFGGIRAQNSPKKSHFMDAESTRKTLKTFNLTTTARNSVFWHNFYEFLDYIKNRHICHALPFVASLVKVLYKFHEKPPKIGPKLLLR